MPSIIVYDPNATPAQVKQFLTSVDPSFYQGRQDVKIYDNTTTPTESEIKATVAGKVLKYLKVSGATVLDYTQAEKDAQDASEAAANIAQAKQAAKNLYDATDSNSRLIRAGDKLVVDEINLLREWITAFKAAVAASTSLSNLQTRVAALPDVPDRTYAQGKTAIFNLVDGE